MFCWWALLIIPTGSHLPGNLIQQRSILESPSSSTSDSHRFIFLFVKTLLITEIFFLASFFINSELFWIMNVYSDSSHSAIKYLKDTEINICNLLVMTGDFNIHNSLWDPSFLHCLSISMILLSLQTLLILISQFLLIKFLLGIPTTTMTQTQ